MRGAQLNNKFTLWIKNNKIESVASNREEVP
jgi:hypothetical protein